LIRSLANLSAQLVAKKPLAEFLESAISTLHMRLIRIDERAVEIKNYSFVYDANFLILEFHGLLRIVGCNTRCLQFGLEHIKRGKCRNKLRLRSEYE
jgi:hypothetical protein